MTTFVSDGHVTRAFDDVDAAIDAALDLANHHRRVGIDNDEAGAVRASARALPGMVCCPRTRDFENVECYPLTATTALVSARAAHPARPSHVACAR